MDVQTKKFLEHLKFEGGEIDNIDNDIIQEIFDRIGANIMGKRIFEKEKQIGLKKPIIGKGIKLFENLDKEKFSIELEETVGSPQVTHVKYKVNNLNKIGYALKQL